MGWKVIGAIAIISFTEAMDVYSIAVKHGFTHDESWNTAQFALFVVAAFSTLVWCAYNILISLGSIRGLDQVLGSEFAKIKNSLECTNLLLGAIDEKLVLIQGSIEAIEEKLQPEEISN